MATENVVLRFRADGVRSVERGIDSIANRAKKSATAVQFLKRSLGFIGVAAALRGTISVIAQFEQAISTVGAVSGATSSELVKLRDIAKELGANTRFSATQAAEGLTFLARAGFDVNESLEAIGPTLNLAQAGALDLGRAADIASNVLQGFRLETDQATRVTDVLAKAANSSNTNVAQLGDAMAKAAPFASGLGVSIEETTAAIGALSNAGIQGESAGAGLVRVMAELESPSSKTIELFKKLGVEASQFKVSQVGLTVAIQTLAEAGVDAGDALEAFGVRGGPAFEVLSSSIPDVKELNKELNESAGAAAEVARQMDDNLNGALLATKSALEAVVLGFGELSGSGLEDFFRGLADALRFAASNAGELAQAIGIGLLVPAINLATAAFKRLAIAIAANPIGALTVAITLVVSSLVLFRKNIKLSEDGLVSLDNVIGVFADNIAISFGFVKELLNNVFSNFTFFAKKELAETEKGFFGFARTVAKVADTITFPFQNAVTQIALAFRFGFASIGELAVNVFNSILRSLDGLLIGLQRRLNIFIEKLNVLSAQAGSIIGRGGGFNIGTVDIPQFGEIENTFKDAGRDWAQAAVDAYQKLVKGDGGFTQILNGIIAQSTLGAQEAAAAASNKAALAAPETAPLPTGDAGGDPLAANEKENVLLRDKASILAQVTEQRRVSAEQELINNANQQSINELLKEGSITLDEYNILVEEMGLKMTESQSAMDGFREAFAAIGTTAADVGRQIGEALVGAIDKASDALADFAVNGFTDVESLKEAFSDLLLDLGKQILKIIIQTLILKAIQASLGVTFDPTSAGAQAGSVAVDGGGTAVLPPRAAGGPVSKGDPFLVGENRPEIFRPTQSGNITPMSPESMRPEVNLQVVNVQSLDEVTEALNSPEGQQVILNTVRQNPESL